MVPLDEFRFHFRFEEAAVPKQAAAARHPAALVSFGGAKKRAQKVRFTKPVVSLVVTIDGNYESESVADKEGANRVGDELCGRMPAELFRERRGYIRDEALSMRTNGLLQYQFFTANPLGVPNTPYHRDTTKSVRQLRDEVHLLRKAVAEMLQFAPKVFAEAHPFTADKVAYFAMIGPTEDNRRQCRVNDVQRTHLQNRSPLFVPQTFIPLELEKRLWNHRRKALTSWYKNAVQAPERPTTYREMIRHLQHSNYRDACVPDPFQYFTQDV